MFGEEDAFAALFDLDQPVALPHCIESLVAAEDEVADVVDYFGLDVPAAAVVGPAVEISAEAADKTKTRNIKNKKQKGCRGGRGAFRP